MIRAFAFVILALLSGGCESSESRNYKSYPPNPFPDIKVVAIFPVLNQTRDAAVDGDEFANIIANELAKFSGFRTIRPQVFRQAMAPGEKGPSTVEEALQFGRRLQADAILVCSVTDYDAYTPPRISISVQFLRVSAKRMSGADIDNLVQSASWRSGPYPMSKDRTGHWIASFEDIYDAHEKRIREELTWYAKTQESTDAAFTDDREFLAVQSRYLQFVSNRMIRHIFEVAAIGP